MDLVCGIKFTKTQAEMKDRPGSENRASLGSGKKQVRTAYSGKLHNWTPNKIINGRIIVAFFQN